MMRMSRLAEARLSNARKICLLADLSWIAAIRPLEPSDRLSVLKGSDISYPFYKYIHNKEKSIKEIFFHLNSCVSYYVCLQCSVLHVQSRQCRSNYGR